MKKFLVSLAVLSMTAVLFTACNTGEEKTPATEVTPVTTPVTPDAAKTETTTDATTEVKTDAEAEVKVDATAETK